MCLSNCLKLVSGYNVLHPISYRSFYLCALNTQDLSCAYPAHLHLKSFAIMVIIIITTNIIIVMNIYLCGAGQSLP